MKFAIARVGAIAVRSTSSYRQNELRYVLCRLRRVGSWSRLTGFRGLDYQAMLDGITPGWDAPASGAP